MEFLHSISSIIHFICEHIIHMYIETIYTYIYIYT